MYPDERKENAVSFVHAANPYFAKLDITIERVITDNGSAFRSRAYRPQTNDKAERFIQPALREWAYGHACANSDQRRAALPLWNPLLQLAPTSPRDRLPNPQLSATGDGKNVFFDYSWSVTSAGSSSAGAGSGSSKRSR